MNIISAHIAYSFLFINSIIPDIKISYQLYCSKFYTMSYFQTFIFLFFHTALFCSMQLILGVLKNSFW
jgi:hypothetical protein